jgi:hypothetical protein
MCVRVGVLAIVTAPTLTLWWSFVVVKSLVQSLLR